MKLIFEILIYIPRLLIGGAFLLLPGYVIATLVIYLFSLKYLSLFNFDNYVSLLGLIYKIPTLEKLFFVFISISITFYLYEKTKWGGLTNKILPFGHFNDYE